MKKIFILTAEPSGDKLASKVISKLKTSAPDIEYLSVGGEYLKSLGIKSIYELKEITYLGFTKVLMNLFKIRKRINDTVKKIIEFKPDILFSVDSPDFTLRVAKKVKKINPNIKVIHFVSPKIYVWRENRIKEFKNFLDHILLLFPFEKKFYEKEKIKCTFTGHPLIETTEKNKIDLNQLVKKDKKIFSIYPGSRFSEIKILTPILFEFIELMNKNYDDLLFVLHSTSEFKQTIQNEITKYGFKNCETVSDENIKSELLSRSIFAVAKSGTISLEICNFRVPSIIIYKMNSINFLIVKLLAKVKFANIINIAANEEVIPELLQSKCNSKNIFETVQKLLNNKEKLKNQIEKSQKIIKDFKTNKSSEIAASILIKNF